MCVGLVKKSKLYQLFETSGITETEYTKKANKKRLIIFTDYDFIMTEFITMGNKKVF